MSCVIDLCSDDDDDQILPIRPPSDSFLSQMDTSSAKPETEAVLVEGDLKPQVDLTTNNPPGDEEDELDNEPLTTFTAQPIPPPLSVTSVQKEELQPASNEPIAQLEYQNQQQHNSSTSYPDQTVNRSHSDNGVDPDLDDNIQKVVAVPQSTSSVPQQQQHGPSSNMLLPKPAELAQNDDEVQSLRKELQEVGELVCEYEALLSEAQSRHKNLEAKLKTRLSSLREQADMAFNWLTPFPWDAQLWHQLENVFHIRQFRALQHEALNATLLKRDVFAILPTGAGKSLIYQLAAVVDAGLTVVITPLISLSQDQQKELNRLGIRAEALDSTTPQHISKKIYHELLPPSGRIPGSKDPRKPHNVYALARKLKNERKKNRRARNKNKNQQHNKSSNNDGYGNGDGGGGSGSDGWIRDDMETAILFVTPEQVVKSNRLMNRLESLHESGHLSRICIDEAHCCSVWGHDFRADYRKLGIIRRQCPDVPILALTATCGPDTTSDVAKILEMRDCVTFRGSIDRANLFYEVLHKPDSEDDVINLILELLNSKFKDMCGIIYVLSRKEAETYAEKITSGGIRARCYHGDLERGDRSNVHNAWSDGNLRVVVATVAFGLGINNHETRFVIHATMATSLEGYYQESGRCGRDGRQGYCLVLVRPKDFPRLSGFVADKGHERVEKFYEMYKYVTGRSGINVGEDSKVVSLEEEEETGRIEQDIARKNVEFVNQFCRRAILASAFGETPPPRVERHDSNNSNKTEKKAMSTTKSENVYNDDVIPLLRDCCDMCRSRSDKSSTSADERLVRVDVSDLAASVVRIMINICERKPNERVTMLALAQNWAVNGLKAKVMRGDEDAIDRRINLDTRMEIIIELVLRKGLDEFFRHSTYAINSYIVPGEKSETFAYDSSAKVELLTTVKAAWQLHTYADCPVLDGVDVAMGKPTRQPRLNRKVETKKRKRNIVKDKDDHDDDDEDFEGGVGDGAVDNDSVLCVDDDNDEIQALQTKDSIPEIAQSHQAQQKKHKPKKLKNVISNVDRAGAQLGKEVRDLLGDMDESELNTFSSKVMKRMEKKADGVPLPCSTQQPENDKNKQQQQHQNEDAAMAEGSRPRKRRKLVVEDDEDEEDEEENDVETAIGARTNETETQNGSEVIADGDRDGEDGRRIEETVLDGGDGTALDGGIIPARYRF